MLKDSKKQKKNCSNGVPTPSGGTQPHIKSECPTPDPLAANAGTTVPSVTVKDEPSTPNGGESMNNCEHSGSNNCATLGGQSGNTSSGPQPTSGPDIKPNVCGPGGGMNPMMGPNNVGSNPMDNFLNDPPMDKNLASKAEFATKLLSENEAVSSEPTTSTENTRTRRGHQASIVASNKIKNTLQFEKSTAKLRRRNDASQVGNIAEALNGTINLDEPSWKTRKRRKRRKKFPCVKYLRVSSEEEENTNEIKEDISTGPEEKSRGKQREESRDENIASVTKRSQSYCRQDGEKSRGSMKKSKAKSSNKDGLKQATLDFKKGASPKKGKKKGRDSDSDDDDDINVVEPEEDITPVREKTSRRAAAAKAKYAEDSDVEESEGEEIFHDNDIGADSFKPKNTKMALSGDDIKKMKVADLKTELTNRGLDSKGLKKDLVERLKAAIFGENGTETPNNGGQNNGEDTEKQETEVPEEDESMTKEQDQKKEEETHETKVEDLPIATLYDNDISKQGCASPTVPGCTMPSHIYLFTENDMPKEEVFHTGGKPIECFNFEEIFSNKDHLSDHQNIHAGKIPIERGVCKKPFTSGTNLSRQRSHAGKKPFECNICEKRFHRKLGLSNHQRTHTGEKPFKCDICEKTFRQKSNLFIHQKTHTGEKAFECDICKKRLTSRANLSRHQNTHTSEKPFVCDICEKPFRQKINLSIHQRIHTGEKPFECDACKKCFSSTSGLSNHQRYHIGDKPFMCDVCNKCFISNSRLTLHQRTHTGEKPFECDICKKCFISNSCLTLHQRFHTGEKPFECGTCGKTFHRKFLLSDHEKTHTGEKPFECSICGKKFRRKNHLSDHQRTHSGEKSFECEKCGKLFASRSGLSSHLKSHTDGKAFEHASV
ncbi:hypothetical protein QYM36_019049 [Artemia franciscana]|uniref:Uncharacterized protein n=2 Tax=Artemia franciscana TaxID=6661 RepID=A0AA88H8G3_ARTSF|nr:hypothetical protein QYM36_019049 [Artemia franciscana]